MGRAAILPGAGSGLQELNLTGGTVCLHPQGLVPERGSSGWDKGNTWALIQLPLSGMLPQHLFPPLKGPRISLSLAPSAVLPPQQGQFLSCWKELGPGTQYTHPSELSMSQFPQQGPHNTMEQQFWTSSLLSPPLIIACFLNPFPCKTKTER